MTPHSFVNPASLAEPIGYAHAAAASAGHLVVLAGQTAQGRDGKIRGDTLVEQFDVAAANVVTALAAVGGRPEHVVSLTIYTTDMPAYRAALSEIGKAYRQHFGRHYPAMALLGVAELFDEAAMVELVGVAVVTDLADLT